MNQAKLLILSLIITLSFSSCDKENDKTIELAVRGPIIEETRNYDAYTRIVTSIGSITITEGEPGAITIRTNTSIMEYIETSVKNNVLYVTFREGYTISMTDSDSLEMNITVLANNISRIEGSGGSSINVAKNNKVFNSSSLSIQLSGGGSFSGDIDVKTIETLSVDLSGGGSFRGIVNVKELVGDFSGGSRTEILGGSVKTLTVDLSGGGHFNGTKFTTGSLDARMSGAAVMLINITEEITRADLSGSSFLYYTGKDIKTNSVETSGSSKVIKLEDTAFQTGY